VCALGWVALVVAAVTIAVSIAVAVAVVVPVVEAAAEAITVATVVVACARSEPQTVCVRVVACDARSLEGELVLGSAALGSNLPGDVEGPVASLKSGERVVGAGEKVPCGVERYGRRRDEGARCLICAALDAVSGACICGPARRRRVRGVAK
jgi:hypothetical protein